MSYHGTVYCSFCGIRGHNKNGCSKRKEWYERLREQDPHDWRVKDYDNKKTRTKTRKCSFCYEPGHNRRKCPSQKKYGTFLSDKTKEYRSQLLHHFRSHGVGIGALLWEPGYDGSSEPNHVGVYLIIGIQWERVHWHRRIDSNLIAGKRMADPLDNAYGGYRLAYPLTLEEGLPVWLPGEQSAWWNRNKVIGPVKSVKPPQGWLQYTDTASLDSLRAHIKQKNITDIKYDKPYQEWCALQESSEE
jgi:hypothetical protein